MQSANVVFVGVGGQGIVLASDILGEAAVEAGYDVKKSDAIGMAQRGGSVSSHVRLGPKVYSPLVEPGTADFLIGFEKLEAARGAALLREGGLALVNDQVIFPITVSSGGQAYPSDDEVLAAIRSRTDHAYVVDAQGMAAQLGNVRVVNIILLGVVSRFLDVPSEIWHKVIDEKVPPRYRDLNLAAFEHGRALAGTLAGTKQARTSGERFVAHDLESEVSHDVG